MIKELIDQIKIKYDALDLSDDLPLHYSLAHDSSDAPYVVYFIRGGIQRNIDITNCGEYENPIINFTVWSKDSSQAIESAEIIVNEFVGWQDSFDGVKIHTVSKPSTIIPLFEDENWFRVDISFEFNVSEP